MHYIDEVRVWLEVSDLFDGMIESIQEPCHSLLIIFFDIGSYHGNLHFLVVLFNALGALHELLKFLEEVAVVVVWHESFSHDILHLCPSSDGWITSCLAALDDLFPPNEDIVLELDLSMLVVEGFVVGVGVVEAWLLEKP